MRKFVSVLISLLLFGGISAAAFAHPLGNFTINHYARLEVASDQLRVRLVLDYAEIPAFQEKQNMDGDADGKISEAERLAYLAAQTRKVVEKLSLTVNGQAAPLTPDSGSEQLEFLPGQGGLEVMRLSMWLVAPYRLGSSDTVMFRDANYPDRLGWREIVVKPGNGVGIQNSSVSDQETSQELKVYPENLLTNPRADREATFTAVPGTGVTTSPTVGTPITTGALGAFDRTREAFGKLLVTNQELSPWVLLVSFVLAMGLGALHAFSPGHGKAVVGAYLVGTRGNWKQALFLGLIVTITHTAGVYALGAVTLFLSEYILPEQLFPWMGFISGALVAVIGIRLFVQRMRAARTKTSSYDKAMSQMKPSTAARQADAQQHAHNFATPEEEAAHAREHLAEIQAFEKPSWKNLLSLGISGGLLPCPSALVVMLSAIALGRVLYGFFLIIGFSLGLAGVLVLTGLALLYAGKFAGRYLGGNRVGTAMRYVPLVGAFFVAILGVGIALDAFFQTGIVP